MTVRAPRSARLLGGVILAVGIAALAGCSGSDAPAPSPTKAGPCDTGALARHAGVAAGAVQTFVWKPYRAGALKSDAKNQKQAMALAAAAAARSAQELGAVSAVQGCQTSLSLSSAVATGKALSASVSTQLKAGKVNPEALGGLNSAITLVVQQAEEAGVTVKVAAPAEADLVAG